MNIILVIIILISIAYLLIISIYSIGWFRLSYFSGINKRPSVKISIIIPVRNEEGTIANCLNDIIHQNYSKELTEIIVADDFSEDKTLDVIENLIKTYKANNEILNIKCISNNVPQLLTPNSQLPTPNSQLTGKKEALNNAISAATGELIITTDSDCRMGNNWLTTIAAYYETYKPKMIIGPVCFKNENNLFKQLQSLEFLSLIGTTAGSAAVKMPIMCNGANLAFQKQAFIETSGYKGNADYAGGDDMFLLESVHRKYLDGVHFLKNKDAIVYTEASNNINDFLNQRKRWVSKTKGYKSLRIIFVAIIVYLFNLSLLGLLIAGMFIHELFLTFICLFIAKSIVDFIILSGVTSFMRKRGLLILFLPLEFINIIYVSLIGFIGSFSNYRWKTRIINK